MVRLPISVKNMETKKQIRKEILSVRDAIDKKKRAEYSRQICKRVFQLPGFVKSQSVLCFVGYGSEPDTEEIIQTCFQMGKRVYCPRVIGDEMEFYEIKDCSELISGYKGIMEPLAREEARYVPGKSDFMLLPGVVFDREGNRIGYGKGFYDRYLAKQYQGDMAAIAYSCQIVANGRIITETTDKKVNCIVTETELIRI